MSNAIQDIFGTIVYGLHISRSAVADRAGYKLASVNQMLSSQSPDLHQHIFDKVCEALVMAAKETHVLANDRDAALRQIARLKEEFEKLKEPGNNPTPT